MEKAGVTYREGLDMLDSIRENQLLPDKATWF
jgi:hypothetical protein